MQILFKSYVISLTLISLQLHVHSFEIDYVKVPFDKQKHSISYQKK